MPELPEVEVISRGLAPHVEGRVITAFAASGRKLRLPVPKKALATHVEGRRCIEIYRRAKYLVFRLDNEAAMIVHLGMTGRLGIFAAGSPRQTHDHLRFSLDSGMEMRLNDARRFGSVQVAATSDLLAAFFADCGPEPFSEGFSADWLAARAAGRRTPVKTFLLDGKVVAGIGNIYASEILFAAKTLPQTPAAEIPPRRWRRIAEETVRVLARAIDCGGTTISDYVNASGESGYFQNELMVYGREGERCRNCQGRISREVMAGRATFFCRRCQK